VRRGVEGERAPWRIDLHTGGGAAGFDALLQNLYRLGREAEDKA